MYATSWAWRWSGTPALETDAALTDDRVERHHADLWGDTFASCCDSASPTASAGWLFRGRPRPPLRRADWQHALADAGYGAVIRRAIGEVAEMVERRSTASEPSPV
ncbi:hypothetical protein [Saccharothrix longispora]|uniref:hypothetical protein n=1 Tax=Saccharothrix longispora TaxID=33920 RepID=UPI0028FDAF02|nr:hypothetical protein [Saccharothrix longispora]MBY8850105.1 hypothetical protein [Saccharothrix sp. MB29]MDU0289557.1 hypothetical protein [Saccharothrix longispora]